MNDTRLVEVADGVYQATTYLPDIDFSVNQYLVLGDEPLLFHTGMRQLFASVTDALSTVIPITELRWVAFRAPEADECGSINLFLAAAPHATAVQGMTGCMISIGDLADRPPRPLAEGERPDIGGHELQWIDTPHVPHAWEAGLLYDRTTRTLLCGDLFSQWGRYPASTTDAIADEDSSWMSLAPSSAATLRRLATLEIDTLAPMHGPGYTGDCQQAILALAAQYRRRIDLAADAVTTDGRGR